MFQDRNAQLCPFLNPWSAREKVEGGGGGKGEGCGVGG